MNWKEWHEYAENETLWRNHQEKGLLKAEYVRDYVLRLWFEDDLATIGAVSYVEFEAREATGIFNRRQLKSFEVIPVIELQPSYMFDGVDHGPTTREEIQALFRSVVRSQKIASINFCNPQSK